MKDQLLNVLNRAEFSKLAHEGFVTTFGGANTFSSTFLAHYGDGAFDGWYVGCVWDQAGAAAAPQGEFRLITQYATISGAFTHNAFSANLAAGDRVVIISPLLYEILTIRGGAETLESLMDEHQAQLDLGEGDPQTLLMDGTEQTLVETTGSAFIYEFLGLFIDWTGLNFGGGEDTEIRAYIRVDGVNYREVYSETFLAAARPVPVVTVHPRNANTDILVPALTLKADFRITATQAAIGGGWNSLNFFFVDAKRSL